MKNREKGIVSQPIQIVNGRQGTSLDVKVIQQDNFKENIYSTYSQVSHCEH